jgi:hypothetical protein
MKHNDDELEKGKMHRSQTTAKGFGLLSSQEYLLGLKVHSVFGVTTWGVPLGLVHQQVWAREPSEKGKTKQRSKRHLLDQESKRWLIERYHYVLKSCCGLEQLQLETYDRIIRALATYSIVAWRLLWLTYESRVNGQQPCNTVLEAHEWQALSCHIHQCLTLRRQPPSLHQAVRWIAQIGGFLGRTHDGEPGVKTIWRGLRRLHDIASTWKLISANSLSHNYFDRCG